MLRPLSRMHQRKERTLQATVTLVVIISFRDPIPLDPKIRGLFVFVLDPVAFPRNPVPTAITDPGPPWLFLTTKRRRAKFNRHVQEKLPAFLFFPLLGQRERILVFQNNADPCPRTPFPGAILALGPMSRLRFAGDGPTAQWDAPF